MKTPPRVVIGGKYYQQPYSASLFNISAMSFGALCKNAIQALNFGAKAGGFFTIQVKEVYQNTIYKVEV